MILGMDEEIARLNKEEQRLRASAAKISSEIGELETSMTQSQNELARFRTTMSPAYHKHERLFREKLLLERKLQSQMGNHEKAQLEEELKSKTIELREAKENYASYQQRETVLVHHVYFQSERIKALKRRQIAEERELTTTQDALRKLRARREGLYFTVAFK